MTRFAHTIRSDDRIAVAASEVWQVLTDPSSVARLTPLVDDITVEGDRWRWRLVSISALGITAAPAFTTVIRLTDGRRIDFTPDPGRHERASALGHLTVDPDDGWTMVAIDVTATVELPLPRAATGPVRRVMHRTMRAGGTRFARNLLAHLGDPPHRGLAVR